MVVVQLYQLWPPFNEGAADSGAVIDRVFSPVRLQRPFPINFKDIEPDSHYWIYAYWRPACNVSTFQSVTEGDFLSVGQCDGKCETYQAGKGVPHFMTSAKGDMDGVVIRLNTIRRTGLEVVSRCD